MRLTTIVFLLSAGFLNTAYSQGLVLKYQELLTDYSNHALWPRADFAIPPDLFDFDGNGMRDLAIAKPTTQSFDVYGFPGMILLFSTPPDFAYMQFIPLFSDFDGDGVKDIFYSPCCGGGNRLAVYSPVRNESILLIDSILVYYGEDYFLSDYDGDNLLDIALHVGTTGVTRFEIWGAGQVSSSPPSNLVIATQGDNVILQWLPVDSCSMYRVKWSLSAIGDFVEVGTTCANLFTHAGAAIIPGAYYQVQAVTSTIGDVMVGQAHYTSTQRASIK